MPIPSNTKKITRLSAKDIALQQLQQWIIDGTLQPDEKINDIALAQAIGVSRTPVREALQILALSGLVEAIPGQKTKIASIRVEDIQTMYETMVGLQIIVAKQALPQLNDQHIVTLRQLNKAFEDALVEKDTKKAMQADAAFHHYITDLAQNPYITPALTTIDLHIQRLEYVFFQKLNDDLQSVQEHEHLIHALQSNNNNDIEKIIRLNWLRPMAQIQHYFNH